MTDTERLRNAISSFESSSSPHSWSTSSPATIGDINKIRTGIVNVLKVFVDELEKS